MCLHMRQAYLSHHCGQLLYIKRNPNIVDLTKIDHPAVKEYLTTADRRILAGARFMLETLDIPYPDYLERKPAGRPIAKEIMHSFRLEHPETLHQATLRKQRQLTRPIT